MLFLPPEQIQSIQDNLARMGPLLSGPLGPLSGQLAWKGLTLVNLLKQARERAGKIDPGAPLDAADEQFLTQLLSVVRSAAATVNDPAAYRNPWDSLLARPPQQQDLLAQPQYFFSGDGSLAFLLVRPVKEADSFTPALTSVSALRDLVAARRADFPELQIGLTGMPVLETDEMDASQRDSNTAGYLAFVGVAIVYVGMYRGFRYPLLTMAALGRYVLGDGLARTDHRASEYSVERVRSHADWHGRLWRADPDALRGRAQAGRNVLDATLLATRAAGPSILTAAVGTALAFFAAMFADFTAVAELGWIAGWGVFLCAFACFTVLPALIVLTDHRPTVGGGLSVITPEGERVQPAIRPPESERRRRPGCRRWRRPALGARGRVGMPRGPRCVHRPGRLRSQLAAHAGRRFGIGPMGAEANFAHGRGELVRSERGEHAAGSAGPEGAL